MGVPGITPFDVALQVDPDARRDAFLDDNISLVVGKLSTELSQEYGRFLFDPAVPAVVIESTRDGAGTYRPLVMRAGGAERVRVTDTGQVGIGTITPEPTSSVRLDVVGGNVLVDNGRSYLGRTFAGVPSSLIGVAAADYVKLGDVVTSSELVVLRSGKVGVGTTAPDASALLDLTSTTKGFLAPRMTTAQRDLIAAPATGLEIFNTTTGRFEFYTGAVWASIGVTNHGALTGLLDDDHTQYALLAGRAGGQTWIGGTVAGQGATIRANPILASPGAIRLEPEVGGGWNPAISAVAILGIGPGGYYPAIEFSGIAVGAPKYLRYWSALGGFSLDDALVINGTISSNPSGPEWRVGGALLGWGAGPDIQVASGITKTGAVSSGTGSILGSKALAGKQRLLIYGNTDPGVYVGGGDVGAESGAFGLGVAGTNYWTIDGPSGGDTTLAEGVDLVIGAVTGTKIGTTAAQLLGFHGATPTAQQGGWTTANVATDRSFDADATTLNELADVVGTLIEDLKTKGLIGA